MGNDTVRINKNKRLYILHQKAWWRNMNNIIINYRHKGEETDIRFINMNKKCRIDRKGIHPYPFMGMVRNNDRQH